MWPFYASIDYCDIEDRIEMDIDSADKVIDQVKAVGLDLDQIMMELQTEGVDKFVKPFASLMASLETKVKQLTPA